MYRIPGRLEDGLLNGPSDVFIVLNEKYYFPAHSLVILSLFLNYRVIKGLAFNITEGYLIIQRSYRVGSPDLSSTMSEIPSKTDSISFITVPSSFDNLAAWRLLIKSAISACAARKLR